MANAGAVQQLDGASPACVPQRCRTGGPGEKTHQDNADTALIRLLTSNKDSRTRHSASARRVRLSGADPSVSCVHAGIVSPTTCADFRLQQ